MLFHEIYGAYFNAVSHILTEAVSGNLDKEKLHELVNRYGFSESILSIPQKFMDGSWPVLHKDLTTPLRHAPQSVVTDLQKRWLKSLLLDPRIRLFNLPDDPDALKDVEPLFDPALFIFPDRKHMGDPFDSPVYIHVFRTLLSAIHAQRSVLVTFSGSTGKEHKWKLIPYRLEYSSSDDRFRLLGFRKQWRPCTLLVSCISHVEYEPSVSFPEQLSIHIPLKEVVFEFKDERNTLERILLQLSQYEKETEQLDPEHYRVRLKYRSEDEAEMIVQLLSFGPYLRILFPDSLVRSVKERVQKQAQLWD